MLQELSHLGQVLGFAVLKVSAAVANTWRATIDRAGRYRPEAHYMRGPGPKWRAKNAPRPPAHPHRLMPQELFGWSFIGTQSRLPPAAAPSPPPPALSPSCESPSFTL